jgi:hypothetical protein
MMDKFERFLDMLSGGAFVALVIIFTIGFLVSLLLGNWDAATAFGIGHIGLQMLID